MLTSRYSSLRQLAGVVSGFLVTILLLESEALALWAQRLEVGYARTGAVQVTAAVHRAFESLGVERVRQRSLASLDRLGWSDDPARLEAARDKRSENASDTARQCNAMVASGSLSVPAVPRTIAPLRGLGIPLLPRVPAATPLVDLPPAPPGTLRKVALVGDSMMAVGLAEVLLQHAAADRNLRIIKAFRSGTGLSRPDIFDWMKEYPAMIGAERPEAIIVAIGANDGQGFIDNGKVLAFGSDAWVKAYQQRTAAFLDLLSRDGTPVVWVGLPPMKPGIYNNKIAMINRIAYTTVSQFSNATWWNPLPYIGDHDGGFREFDTTPDGRPTRLRAADGIHLSGDGAALLVPVLLNWLNPAPPPARIAELKPPSAPLGARRTRIANR